MAYKKYISRTFLLIVMFQLLAFLFFNGCAPKVYLSSYSNPKFNPKSIKKVIIILNDLRIRNNAVFGEIFLQTALEKNKFFLVSQKVIPKKNIPVAYKNSADAFLFVGLTHSITGNLTRTLPTSVAAFAKLVETRTDIVFWNMNYGFKSYDVGPDAPMIEEVMKNVAVKLIDSVPLEYVAPYLASTEEAEEHYSKIILPKAKKLSENTKNKYKPALTIQLKNDEKKEVIYKKDSNYPIPFEFFQKKPIEISKDEPTRTKKKDDNFKRLLPEKNDLKETFDPNQGPKNTQIAAPPNKNYYSVQVGAFLSKENAENRIALIKEKGYAPYLLKESDSKKRVWYIAHIGKYLTRRDAKNAAIAVSAKTKVATAVRLFNGL